MSAHAHSVVGLLLNSQTRRRQRQVAAEIGVWQGETSHWLLTCCPHLTLHLIEPFMAGDPGGTWYQHGDSMSRRPQSQHNEQLSIVRRMTDTFSPRVTIHQDFSVQASKDFEDGSLDLAFIDAAHDADNVRADIAAWYPKIRSGGILSGHDYRPGAIKYGGLQREVDAFIARTGLKLNVATGKVWWVTVP